MHNQNYTQAHTLPNPPDLFTKGLNLLLSIGCQHSNTILIKYEIRQSNNPKFTGTEHEYQEIRLRPAQQFYQCTTCRTKIGYLFDCH